MFSPDLQTTSTAASTRNPRRRQRGERDSATPQQPVRKRSKLSQETFAPADASYGMNGAEDASSQRMNGSANGVGKNSHGSANLTVREKKANGSTAGSKRGGRPDVSTTLTKTPKYTFKQLPAFPEKLKNSDAGEYRIHTQPGTNYALALTRTQALIWDYTTSFANPAPRVFTYPQPVKLSDPLPFGTLVTSASSTDLGLVLLGAKDGKITFWENIEFADSAALFHQRQQGVEGYIKLLGGETVAELVGAHHAGYLLRLSGGRLAHFSIRDQQGRPAVSVSLLEGQKAPGWGLRNIFQGSWQKRDLTAVKARPGSRKSHVDVRAVTRDATITEWDFSWDGKQTFRREFNVGAVLRAALRDDESTNLQEGESLQVLDFAHLQGPIARGDELVAQADGETAAILACVAIQGNSQTRFALVELLLFDDQVGQGAVFAVTTYKSTSKRHLGDSSAKLLLPDPGHTALVLAEDQLAVVEISPEAEHRFQDTLALKYGEPFDIIASSCEEHSGRQQTANCLLVTRSTGITRVSLEEGGTRHRLSPRAKFEQAVYFAHLPDTFLKLGARPAYRYSEEDVEEALVSVSHAILDSTCEFLPSATPSPSEQIKFRTRRLRDLQQFTTRNFPNVSREVKWRIAWDTEKVEALHKIWQAYEQILERVTSAQPPLLQTVLERAQQKGTLRPNTKIDSKAALMHWFVTDGRSVRKIVPWTYDAIHDIFNEKIYDNSEMLNYTNQADQIAILTLGTAYQFRQSNAADFGLGEEQLDRGLLVTGYEDLPEPWTSSLNIVNGIRQLTEFSRVLVNFMTSQEDGLDEHDSILAQDIASENVDLVDLSCRAHVERTRWLLNHGSNEDSIRAGEKWKAQFDRDLRPNLITGLMELGQAARGMTLAEQFHDLDSLAVLTLEELRFHDPEGEEASKLEPGQQQHSLQRFKELKKQVDAYSHRYGAKWANIFCGKMIEQDCAAEILDKDYGAKQSIDDYLHALESRARLAWISDITNDGILAKGAKSLYSAATVSESNSWCQNVELSLAKLALLAVESKETATENGNLEQDRLSGDVDRCLRLSRLQQRLYTHLLPSLKDTLDPAAYATICMQNFAPTSTENSAQPALDQLLYQGFEAVTNHRVTNPALLIDVLTLMKSKECEVDADDISGKEYLMALQVLQASEIAQDPNKTLELEGLARLLWKRCFVRDEWTEIIHEAEGKTEDEITEVVCETAAFKTLKEGNLMALWNVRPAFELFAPSATIGACSTVADIKSRFEEDLATAIAADNARDDTILQSYIDDVDLDNWFTLLQKLAKQAAIDDSPAARDVEERKALKNFIDYGFEEPKFNQVSEVRPLRGIATVRSKEINGYDDEFLEEGDYGAGFDADEDEGYEEGYEDEEDEREDGDDGDDGVDGDGDVEMG